MEEFIFTFFEKKVKPKNFIEGVFFTFFEKKVKPKNFIEELFILALQKKGNTVIDNAVDNTKDGTIQNNRAGYGEDF